MTVPAMQEISGQGGNVTIGAYNFGVRRWSIRKQFRNVPTTDTSCGGWERVARVIAGWSFVCEVVVNKNQSLDGTEVDGTLVVPNRAETPTPVAAVFVLGNSGYAYSGTGLIDMSSLTNDAEDVATHQLVGRGTGALSGPTAI